MKDLTRQQLSFLRCVEPKPWAPETERETAAIARRFNADPKRYGRAVTVDACRSRLRLLEDRGLVRGRFNGAAPVRWVLTSKGVDVLSLAP